jgi:hypothetical protein
MIFEITKFGYLVSGKDLSAISAITTRCRGMARRRGEKAGCGA